MLMSVYSSQHVSWQDASVFFHRTLKPPIDSEEGQQLALYLGKSSTSNASVNQRQACVSLRSSSAVTLTHLQQRRRWESVLTKTGWVVA